MNVLIICTENIINNYWIKSVQYVCHNKCFTVNVLIQVSIFFFFRITKWGFLTCSSFSSYTWSLKSLLDIFSIMVCILIFVLQPFIFISLNMISPFMFISSILLSSSKLFISFLYVYSPVSGTSFQKLQISYHYIFLNPKNNYAQVLGYGLHLSPGTWLVSE
jgi:hypothetical protein